MEKLRADKMVVVMRLVMMMGWLALSPVGVMGDLHKVGGSKGWRPDVNYTEWSAKERVYVGDWLLFNFDKRYFNVLEVNKTSYDTCIDRDFIKNVTRGGRDVVQLTEARTYYYLSSGGYCFHQMRVSINVVEEHQNHALIAEAPAPSQNSGSLIVPSVCACIWIILANVVHVSLAPMGIL